jgi:hypothetical protein
LSSGGTALGDRNLTPQAGFPPPAHDQFKVVFFRFTFTHVLEARESEDEDEEVVEDEEHDQEAADPQAQGSAPPSDESEESELSDDDEPPEVSVLRVLIQSKREALALTQARCRELRASSLQMMQEVKDHEALALGNVVSNLQLHGTFQGSLGAQSREFLRVCCSCCCCFGTEWSRHMTRPLHRQVL